MNKLFAKKTLVSISISISNTTNSHLFCTVLGLKQIIKSPTCINCRNTSLIDHILASILSQIARHGVINISASDHQLIYCTINFNKSKTGSFC